MLPDRIHPDTGLDQGEGPDAVHGHLFVGVMGVLTDEFHVPFPLGFLDVFDRDVLFAVDVDREQVHVAPEDVADILELFVKYDVAAFEQRVHRVAHDVYRTVAFGQVRDMDVVHRNARLAVVEQRNQTRRTLDGVERHALQRQRIVGAVAERVGEVRLGIEHLSLARLYPVGIHVQFLNKKVPVARRQSGLARLNHRKCGFADAKSLCELFLCQSQLFPYQFQSTLHIISIGKYYTKIEPCAIQNPNIGYIFALQS